MPQLGLPLVHMHPGTDSQPERSQFKLTRNGANSSYHMLSGSYSGYGVLLAFLAFDYEMTRARTLQITIEWSSPWPSPRL
ncbi:hypothetical protein DTO006G1_355 [Penicillium roqueforti]|uniref:uncharacterized protein n=1 Tax=Penicillium roqueforti TaxID=5082 RepID=UPI00190CC619|nr:uncharacterized protein LCP9604111_7730 [Penicillium roqueforti]KAF9243347.1 hypothetical protein LCP9604111_7730 [Penicillium roqueforti]KAI1833887.1 hypothetical protein CBS147337_5442 [Penicillium roqueforti]KAI2691972.1 hypothetical protein LCP963914a_66 [Penicillium roqueforti]KAI2718100.1 hypothetical protein CBS147318_4677 [Penicillium roqueforti]KAI2722272.1 hypothetical protein CBS147354_5564 [Penicillium roqueforti]